MSKHFKGKSGIVRAWWKALQHVDSAAESEAAPGDAEKARFFFDRGDRARLRRCTTITDAAMEPSVWRLAEALRLEETDSEALLLVASALAHVKEDAPDGRSLAYVLGVGPVGKDEKARLSALRFQRLMRADASDDFLQQLRRALSIGGERVDVAKLAEDLFAWSEERTYPHRRSSGMKFRWARDYYLKRPDQALIPDGRPAA